MQFNTYRERCSNKLFVHYFGRAKLFHLFQGVQNLGHDGSKAGLEGTISPRNDVVHACQPPALARDRFDGRRRTYRNDHCERAGRHARHRFVGVSGHPDTRLSLFRLKKKKRWSWVLINTASWAAVKRESRMTQLFLVFAAILSAGALSAPQPHIIFHLVDDWGYNNVGYRGNPEAVTPNIDALAHVTSLSSCIVVRT